VSRPADAPNYAPRPSRAARFLDDPVHRLVGEAVQLDGAPAVDGAEKSIAAFVVELCRSELGSQSRNRTSRRIRARHDGDPASLPFLIGLAAQDRDDEVAFGLRPAPLEKRSKGL
jgi:hypothetical protein